MVSMLWFGLAVFLGFVYLFFPRKAVLLIGVAALYTSVFAAMGINSLMDSAVVFLALGILIFGVSYLLLKGTLKDEEA